MVVLLWLGVALLVVAAASFAVGFVFFARGSGATPDRRTKEDPTGVKRAGSQISWRDVFRRMPSSVNVMLDKNSRRGERMCAVGSLFVLAAVLALCAGILALIAALV